LLIKAQTKAKIVNYNLKSTETFIKFNTSSRKSFTWLWKRLRVQSLFKI